jgi:DNA polymerase-1
VTVVLVHAIFVLANRGPHADGSSALLPWCAPVDATAQPLPRERVYLLDTHGMIFQMFHGIPAMNAPDGRPTNAVFGVTRALMDLYDHGAEYLIATFDCKEPTFREELYREYKAHRDPPPEDLLAQEPLINQVLEGLRIPIVKKPGFEADDVIATLAVNAVERGFDVFLCTSDKDCRQLLGPHVKIQNLRKGVILDEAGLLQDWGISPKQVVDFQTLVGDSVDNVPGVPGCGPKTAAKWLQAYGTLENLIQNVDALGGPKLRDAFKKAIADGSLETSRTLVRLRTDVPLDFDWPGWKRRDWHGQQLLELFQEFGFRGFANKVRSTLSASGAKRNDELLKATAAGGGTPAAPSPSARVSETKPTPPKAKLPRPDQPSLFDVIDSENPFDAPSEPADTWKGNYRLVDTPEKFEAFLKELRKQRRFAFDLETTSLEPWRAQIVGLAFSWHAEQADYLAVRGPSGSATLDPRTTLEALRPIFENPQISKVNQNIKYDLLVLRHQGVQLAGVAGDSMLAHYLLHAGERSHNLDDLTYAAFGHRNISISELIGKGKKQITMDAVPTEQVCAYASEDADAAWRLTEKYEAELTPAGLRHLYDELEVPLIEVLAELEFNGIRLDLPLLARLSKEMAAQLETMETEIHALAGKSFNIASPKQLRTILFDEMQLPVQKRTGTTNEASTDQESLERLAALGHELPKKIVAHRQVSKLKGTYVDALPALVNPATGRVHTSFNQTVASTGRLSSSDPNLQNIPMRRDQGRQIRQAFIPPDGWQILTADYSQIELRLLAHFCADDQLRGAFAEDRDVHTRVAAEIFQVPESQVTPEQRGVAKTVNFGVIYGISATGLSVQLGMTRKAAEKFIDDYFARYPKVLGYQDSVLARTRQSGFASTILGRKRTFDPSAIRSNSSYQQRNQAEREAINMEIQGSAADLMKKAMLNVHARMKRERLQARLLLTVHDELVFEVPPTEVSSLAKLAREEMTKALELTVPLKVDVSVGPNWLDGEEV